jgi:hypothetical protein
MKSFGSTTLLSLQQSSFSLSAGTMATPSPHQFMSSIEETALLSEVRPMAWPPSGMYLVSGVRDVSGLADLFLLVSDIEKQSIRKK